MPARPCLDCGALTTHTSSRCTQHQQARDRTRNQQPNKQAHRTQTHRRLRQWVLARDGHACIDCSTSEDLTLDYLDPLPPIGTGTQTDDNAVTRCRSCNSRRGATVRRKANA